MDFYSRFKNDTSKKKVGLLVKYYAEIRIQMAFIIPSARISCQANYFRLIEIIYLS